MAITGITLTIIGMSGRLFAGRHIRDQKGGRFGTIIYCLLVPNGAMVRGNFVSLFRSVVAFGLRIFGTMIADRKITVTLGCCSVRVQLKLGLSTELTLRFLRRHISHRGIPRCAGVGKGVYLHSLPLTQEQWLQVGSTLSH